MSTTESQFDDTADGIKLNFVNVYDEQSQLDLEIQNESLYTPRMLWRT